MKKVPLLLGVILLSVGLCGQQSLLVFLEASEKKPFYVKIGNKINASSLNGQVYITELSGTSFDIFIGFPQTDLPESRFQITLKKTDNSFQLKQASQGWNLIDLETDKMIQPAATVVNTAIPLGGVRKTDAFSVMMAGVVNDTSVLYTSVISTPSAVSEAGTASEQVVKSATVIPETSGTGQSPDLQNQGEKKTTEKHRTSAAIDSTRVKHVDSSLAFQKSQAAQQATVDSLNSSTQSTTNNSNTKKDSGTVSVKSDAAAGKDSVALTQSVISKDQNGDKSAIIKDSLEKVAVQDAAARETSKQSSLMDSVAREAALKDAVAKEAASKDAAAKDAASKESAAKDVAIKEAAANDLLKEKATTDSLSKLAVANDASARTALEKDSVPRANILRDSLYREAVAKETAAKEAKDKDSAAKVTLAKEVAAKEARDKDSAAKAALVKETPVKEALEKENVGIKKISEKKTEKTLTVSYTDKSGNGKTDTIQIIIPIDTPAVVVPKKDSTFPRWQSNPRPLTDPVVQKKDSGSTLITGSSQPVSKGPVMVNSDCVNFATEYDLDKLRVKMIAEVSADDRVATAKKVFRTKCFSARQIKALTELFLNDEGKYKFLDTAYPFVSDSQEFRNLVSVLKEDYYIKRFNAMIRL